MGGTLGMVPKLFNPPRSPLKGDVPNKYPLYKMYMGLIIKGPPFERGRPTIFLMKKINQQHSPLIGFFFFYLARFGLAETFALSSTRAAEEKHMVNAALKWYRRLGGAPFGKLT